MRPADDVEVAGRGEEHVATLRGLGDCGDLEAVHRGLEAAERVDLADGHDRAHSAKALGDAPPDPAVTADHRALAGEEEVRRAEQAVDRRLTGPVLVVEHVLGLRLVHGDDGVRKDALLGHRAQADDARGRLLGAALHAGQELAALGVKKRHHVGAVVHRDLRLGLEHRLDVPVVRVPVLAFAGERRDALVLDERRGGVVLGRQRIRRAERDRRAGIAQRDREVRGLSGDVEACADAQPLERLLRRDTLADAREDGHLAPGPLDAA